ncbi:MAG: bifunctional folylpolyglutamate synthase/dihydrofolate synthase [Chitinophagaceae bacterium]|nr:bifunctional folylpolyglutamate synthase/dihydrofolate synthase [Chitinophagaceae bacterium]MCA6452743.1 bifunctional folylpolyglutamate synthase/dihydrofolate synthase [Chitinophagaceae bacterium]MCA6457298.1 bifunctional folylpolyglutamate synthase/dihydrofolate synthase [Chitinophagaceae bacterium]MCA6457547.1 bifunctional folylpolyglutamate synthase/dihydrofolate synthase [Chitinophagaceae bacterium]MCA6463261.1 bifunctional folylpolyglutamate synthase/dihydrofolate synthase [Chitinophag
MTYQETLHYLFTRLPMFSRIGTDAYKKDLTNTIRLCGALGDPQKKFKTIHIAGTNGKGSTSHMLAAILQTAGYKTGLYTSPHLKDFRERIKINGQVCSEEFVIDFTERIKPLINEIEPSFFEITVAMAFDHFAKQGVDVAVIEVGLGGRLDSTNIITPELSVITNIGWDHMNLLGDTLEKIATEKAGIIKKGIPAVIGEVIPETRPVFDSYATSAPLIYAQERRWMAGWDYEHHLLKVEVVDKANNEHHHYQLDLPGIYQTKNLLTVLEAAHQLHLQGWRTDTATIQKALQHVKKLTGLHGRWELIQNNPAVILDVGHNVDGVKQLSRQLELTDYDHLHIITGMVKDKDVDAVLALLPQDATYYFTQAQIPRALDAVTLQQKAAGHLLIGNTYPNVNEALQHALAHAHKNDLVLVCGSVFLVGEVKR